MNLQHRQRDGEKRTLWFKQPKLISISAVEICAQIFLANETSMMTQKKAKMSISCLAKFKCHPKLTNNFSAK